MKLITRNTDYAIRALIYICGRKNKITSVSELVAKTKIPRPFLRKLLQILNKKGILRSSKGQKGGFMLAAEPQEIFLTDLIRIFQGSLKLNECLFKKEPCVKKSICPLNKVIRDIEEDVLKKLKAINVASLAFKFRKLGIN